MIKKGLSLLLAVILVVSTFILGLGQLKVNALGSPTFTVISAEGLQSGAISSEGKVYSWGYNAYGQLGDGTIISRLSPVCISNDPTNLLYGKTVTALRKGDWHTVALDSDGKLYTWGYNTNGQLGDDTYIQKLKPVCISDTGSLATNPLFGKVVTQIHAAGLQTFAISNGKLYAWGRDTSGLLGDGATTQRKTPYCISDIVSSALYGKTIVAVRTGDFFTMALDSDGKLYTWGRNDTGQLGNGIVDPVTKDGNNNNVYLANPSPICISDIGDINTNPLFHKTVSNISAGTEQSMAISGGKLYCWGLNNLGQIGDGTRVDKAIPVCITDINNVKNTLYNKTVSVIASGQYHGLAISGGKVYSWGLGTYVGCGVTTGVDTTYPICLSDITTSLIYGKTAIAIAAAREHSLVLTSAGGAYAFGKNTEGQFGDNTIVDKNYPVAINFLECSITFDATSKGLIGSAQTKVFNLIKDDPITPPTVTPTAGWSFIGWSPSMPATASGADVTYTAQYTPNQYSITFYANGGTPSQASKSVTYLSTYDTLATASLTGYTFAGWWTAALGGTEITSSTTVTIISAQTLYAHWTLNSYTITWATNGGSGGGANSCDHGATPTPIDA
ncbi:MAG: InlB B-repeat-containing protein, partial [Eubacteriales bacterium]